MFLSWHASRVEDSANLQFLDSLNGFIEDVLEGTLQLFLLIQESVDVVLSALLELSEGLLRCLL